VDMVYIFSYIITDDVFVYVHTHNRFYSSLEFVYTVQCDRCDVAHHVGCLRQLRLVKHGFEFAQDCYETSCKDVTVVFIAFYY